MAKVDVLALKVAAFSESTTKLAETLTGLLSRLKRLQDEELVLTADGSPLAANSFLAPAGSAAGRLLDVIAERLAIMAVLDGYGQLISALGSGKTEDVVQKQRLLFETASETLESMKAPEPAADRGVEKELEKDATKLTEKKDLTPLEDKLEVVGSDVHGVLSTVGRVARLSKPGRIANVVVMISDRIWWRVRLKKGWNTLAKLMPPSQSDIERLVKIITGSEKPLSAAANRLCNSVLTWNNSHRPSVDDPARFGYDLKTASMLADTRQIVATLKGCMDPIGQLPEAHSEMVALVSGKPTAGDASTELVKSAARAAR